MAMKALRLHAQTLANTAGGNEKLRSTTANKSWKNPTVRLETVEKPRPIGKEVLLQVAFCGVCGSDFHLSANSESGTLLYPGLLSLPVTIGHEFSGKIVEHGPEMTAREKAALPLGTPVTAEEMLWCGECNACRAGHVNHCENLEEIGFTIDGGHAEFLKIGNKYCWSLLPLVEKFGEEKALQMGALVEPYSVAYRALFQGAHISNWMPGNTIFIFGSGPIGLAALDLARAAGATKIAVAESNPERRELAKHFGADAVTAPLPPEQLAQWVRNWNNGSGLDWVVDAAGATKTVSEFSNLILNVGGSVCLIARTEESGTLTSEALITKNVKVFGSQGHSGQSAFPRVIAMMAAGLIHPHKLIKRVVSMEEAQERLLTQNKCSGKILLQPSL